MNFNQHRFSYLMYPNIETIVFSYLPFLNILTKSGMLRIVYDIKYTINNICFKIRKKIVAVCYFYKCSCSNECESILLIIIYI